ncbi:uncharacterized protein LOC107884108 [Acyrthosiphon pisum]|uniref:Uncharacterized protein n=1 Tax=Acyrthosiphon pisum TaxID=7029 RepID=A0A8R2D5Z7_ACYPI|nr:uncharacterized protein LOC107884108 [Acyrthosiphon pisum]|eukprot:XP_016661078.1 PREDICTED: uncharacterized protein LOC107884108 [Acyrthosiphon pisum]
MASVVDEPSVQGKFSWKYIGGYHIPYIVRVINGEHLKLVAVRIAENQLLGKYINYLHADNMYKCTSINSYLISNYEANLLNEINQKHANCFYGPEMFVAKIDVMVTLEDVQEFYTFMDVCYKTLVCNITSGHNDNFGFIRINSESIVPYCTNDGKKYVPIFYFECETEYVMSLAVKLENWNLAYVKFCCKVLQGLKNEFFDSVTWEMLNLDHIKNLYSPETNFEEYWPNMENIQCIINQSSNRVNQPGAWFREPEVPSENNIPHALIELAPLVPHSIPEDKNTHQNGWPANQMINSYTIQTQLPLTVRNYFVARRNRSIAPRCYNTGSMSRGRIMRYIRPMPVIRSSYLPIRHQY